MVKSGLALAAEELEAAPSDIEFVKGELPDQGHRPRDFHPETLPGSALARSTSPTRTSSAPLSPTAATSPRWRSSPRPATTEIVSYVACDDAGNIINHQIVEGQVQGGLTQGAGQVFSELAVYDAASGQLLTGSFMDYAMPRAGLVNGLQLLEHPVPTKLNPLGAKGVGEAGVTGSMPALMNAVVDALLQAGVQAIRDAGDARRACGRRSSRRAR